MGASRRTIAQHHTTKPYAGQAHLIPPSAPAAAASSSAAHGSLCGMPARMHEHNHQPTRAPPQLPQQTHHGPFIHPSAIQLTSALPLLHPTHPCRCIWGMKLLVVGEGRRLLRWRCTPEVVLRFYDVLRETFVFVCTPALGETNERFLTDRTYELCTTCDSETFENHENRLLWL